MKRNTFIFLFILISLISFLNKLGGDFDLYWRFWWYDIVMHFLGGLWIGLITLWIYYLSGYFKKNKKDKPFVFLLSFLSVLIVGISWEIFEYLFEIVFSSNYISDTALDLIMDILGGLVASIVLLVLNKNKLSDGKI